MPPAPYALTSSGRAVQLWLAMRGVQASATAPATITAAFDDDGRLLESVASRRRRTARHLFLEQAQQRPAPAWTGPIDLPSLPDLPTLASWLALPLDRLEWLATCGARRRKRPLAHQHYVYQLVAKRSSPNRLRLIEAPRIELKAAQHRLLRGLLQTLPVHEACHGFVGGRSVVSHAQAHVGQPLVLRFDLQDFFSHVGEAQVRAIFDTLGYPHGTALRLAALCVARTPEPVIERLLEGGGIDRAQAMRLRSAHLPQGAPTSPMLANLCAFRLDLRLAALAAAVGARYTRYADDLVFSGPASIAGLRVEGRIGAIAIEEGFRLNHRKTRRLGAGGRQTVAGIVVNQRPNLPRVEFDRLRALLHRCVLRGPDAQNVDGHADFRAHLRGRVAWAVQLNPTRARRLQPLWDAIEWP